MPGSNQGSTGGLAPENAYPSTHEQVWNGQQQQGVEQDPTEAAGPPNPTLGHLYQPAMNPGSPSGGAGRRPPHMYNQPQKFVPGQLQGQGPVQQSQPTAEEAERPRNEDASKNRKEKKKRIFFLRPFSFFYQLLFVVCLVLNPSWTVTKVAVVGAFLRASAAGYTGLDPAAFNSLVSRHYPETHRVHAYESAIKGVFELVGRASGDAWTVTTAKVPCASSSTACVWARKALHAGMTAGLTSQRSTLSVYRKMPTIIGQLGGLASDTKAFLLDASTWRLAGLRSNVVSVSKATGDYAVCVSKNVLHISSLVDLMDVAIECGSTSYAAMLSMTDDTISQHTEDEQNVHDDHEMEVIEDEGEDFDYEDPYAQLDGLVPETANATALRDGGQPVEEEAPDNREALEDSAEDSHVYEEAIKEPEVADEPEVVDEPEVADEPEVVDEPEAVDESEEESEEEFEEPGLVQEADILPDVLGFQAPEKPLEAVEPEVSAGEELPEPIAPDEIPPMSDDLPDIIPSEDVPEPIVMDPEVETDGIPPIVPEDSADVTPEEVADDYPILNETREEIQARAQRIIDHEKKLFDRKKRRDGREDVAPGDSEDLRSALSSLPAEEDITPSMPSTPQAPSKPLLESFIVLVRENMTHIITAVVSALVASSFFVLQAIRASGSRLTLSALADMFGGIPRTPPLAIRKARRAIIEDESEDERPTVYRSASSRGRTRRSAVVVDEEVEVLVPEKRNSRSKTPRAGKKGSAKSTAKKSAGETASGASRRSSRRSASRR